MLTSEFAFVERLFYSFVSLFSLVFGFVWSLPKLGSGLLVVNMVSGLAGSLCLHSPSFLLTGVAYT